MITAIAGPDKLVLRGPRLPVARSTTGTPTSSTSREGDVLTFSMTWFPSYAAHARGSPNPIEETIAREDELGERTAT